MENLIGILVFALIAIFMAAGKSAKDQRNRRQERMGRQPQWPGPVAGPGPLGQPRQFRQPQAGPQTPPPVWQPQPPPVPTTTWAPRPAAPAAPQAQPQTQPARTDRGTLVSSDVFTTKLDELEGVGTEGPQGQMDVPDPAADVEQEMSRFEQESDKFRRLQLSQLSDDLIKPDQAPYTVTPDNDTPPAAMQTALTDPDSLARAIVLAEVLGKPKALRGRGRRL